jgi:hypothetical protein
MDTTTIYNEEELDSIEVNDQDCEILSCKKVDLNWKATSRETPWLEAPVTMNRGTDSFYRETV